MPSLWCDVKSQLVRGCRTRLNGERRNRSVDCVSFWAWKSPTFSKVCRVPHFFPENFRVLLRFVSEMKIWTLHSSFYFASSGSCGLLCTCKLFSVNFCIHRFAFSLLALWMTHNGASLQLSLSTARIIKDVYINNGFQTSSFERTSEARNGFEKAPDHYLPRTKDSLSERIAS